MNSAARLARVRRVRDGLTLTELLVAIAIVGLLAALVIPSVMIAREASRRSSCANNLRQFGVALASHDANRGRQGPWPTGPHAHIALLPYLEQQALFASINLTLKPYDSHADNHTALATAVSVFQCPSDGAPYARPHRFNYAICSGYGAQKFSQFNGFWALEIVEFNRVGDGLSSTAAVSEFMTGTGSLDSVPRDLRRIALAVEPPQSSPTQYEAFLHACEAIDHYNGDPERRFQRGGSWGFGALGSMAYTHDLPPNRNACHNGQGDLGNGAWTASSEHPGGVHLLCLDGHCRFVKDSVNRTIWRHLATIRGGEPIGEF